MLRLLLLTSITAICATNNAAVATDFPALSNIFNFNFKFFGFEYGNKVKDIDQMTPEELGQSKGNCVFSMKKHMQEIYSPVCQIDDIHIAHLLDTNQRSRNRKPPIMVKCLEENPPSNEMKVMHSVDDITAILKPIGNATKRHEPGRCVFMIFYTDTSLACTLWAPAANTLPYFYPTLKFAAVDAIALPNFNTEFGVFALPTLLLFHQGRPVVRLHNSSFPGFIAKHTGIKSIDFLPTSVLSVISGPLPTEPVKRTDYILILAWSFIILCMGYYFSKTRLYQQIVEMIKRNWRESEAQLEHN